MKKLYIIRHAKSSWSDLSLRDFDRPLNKRGKRDAPFMGEKLKEKNIVPDLIISSPAKRTKKTIKKITKAMGYNKQVIFNKDLYGTSEHILNKILTKVDNSNEVVFLVGHNTEITMLAENYVGLTDNIPTCGIVEIAFDCDKWADINGNNAKLVSFDYPKKYNEKV